MPKKTAKKPHKSPRLTAAELHEAARLARRAGKADESAKLLELARNAERREAGR